MWRVAGDAGHIVREVVRPQEIRMSVTVAGEAPLGDLRRSSGREGEDFRLVATCFDMS